MANTLTPTADPSVWTAPSKTRPGVTYFIRGVGTPDIRCDCPAYGDCWHAVAGIELTTRILTEEEMSTPTPSPSDRLATPSPSDRLATPSPSDRLATPSEQNTALAVIPGGRSPVRSLQRDRAAQARETMVTAVEAYRPALQMAEFYAKGGLCPDNMGPAQLALVFLKAAELEIPINSALEFLYVVGGKVKMMSQMVQALVQRSGKVTIEIIATTAVKATARGTRPGYQPLEISFTIEEAERAGMIKGGSFGWKNHPADMLRYKTIARVSRLMFADVVSGMDVGDPGLGDIDVSVYRPEEVPQSSRDARDVNAPIPDEDRPANVTVDGEVLEHAQAAREQAEDTANGFDPATTPMDPDEEYPADAILPLPEAHDTDAMAAWWNALAGEMDAAGVSFQQRVKAVAPTAWTFSKVANYCRSENISGGELIRRAASK